MCERLRRIGYLKPVMAYGAGCSRGEQKIDDEPRIARKRPMQPASAPLFRHPEFVGRVREFEQLHAAFQSAIEGRGGLVLLVGEPGIGKTALCERLAEHVTALGGRSVVGHCYEEGSLSLPYLPFVEALRAYVQTSTIEALRTQLGSGAAEVARIVEAVQERLAVELRPPGDPEQDRWRLLRAVTDFLRKAAAAQPLLLIVDDLQDADRGTLDLLLFLAHNLQDAHLLVLGTYRDVEVDRVQPLSTALAELRRAAPLNRLALRGLSVEDVRQLLGNLAVPGASWGLAEAVHLQTEGNPLFVHEVARHILEAGDVDTPAEVLTSLPEGLRDVIGKRLGRLSASTNQALTAAAVIGREFRMDVLEVLAGQSDFELDSVVQEAVGAAVIEERSTVGATATYRFTHALFRQALYERLIAPQRIRLHQQVARALERIYGPRLEEHAVELAEHFAFSSDLSELGRAVGYSEVAGRHAMRVCAYAEAHRHFQRALQVQEMLDPDDRQRRSELLFLLGEAMLPSEQSALVPDTVAAEVFSHAEATHDSERAARAALMALEALWRTSGGALWGGATDQANLWVHRADTHVAAGSPQRVYVDCWQGMLALAAGQLAPGGAHLRVAVERARALGDWPALITASTIAINFLQALRDRPLVEQLALEMYTNGRPDPGLGMANFLLESLARNLVDCGERDKAEEVWRQLVQLASATGDAAVTASARSATIQRALIDGRLDDVAKSGDAVAAGLVPLTNFTRKLRARALAYLGRAADIELSDFTSPHRSVQSGRALVLSWLGRCEEALAIRSRYWDIEGSDDETAVAILLNLLESSVRCGDKSTAAMLSARLSGLANQLYDLVSVGRLLGEAAMFLGRPNDARQYYRQALAVCRKVRFRPEIALLQLDMAELLLEEFPEERSDATQYLHSAMAEARAMHLQPALERAERLLAQLKPPVFDAPAARGLTSREKEVAALLAQGMSNRDIASALVISENTVEVHVKHILGKLSLKSRAQVASWAVAHSLSPGE
jgi:DNA-binding CsgD family transcriptional regulator